MGSARGSGRYYRLRYGSGRARWRLSLWLWPVTSRTDGWGLAAVLMLGAYGALIGTRFYASGETLGQSRVIQRIVAVCIEETAHTRVFYIVRAYRSPPAYTGRALRNRFKERWNGNESDLGVALETERATNQPATREGDFDTAMAWASEAVDMLKSVERAAVPSLPGSAPTPKRSRISAPNWRDR
jgi:nitronate monooxygenase